MASTLELLWSIAINHECFILNLGTRLGFSPERAGRELHALIPRFFMRSWQGYSTQYLHHHALVCDTSERSQTPHFM